MTLMFIPPIARLLPPVGCIRPAPANTFQARVELPPGYAFEWAGTAFQEQRAAGQTGIVLGLAMLFAFLFLALYESWVIPIPVLLSVVVGVLGAIAGILIAKLTLDLDA